MNLNITDFGERFKLKDSQLRHDLLEGWKRINKKGGKPFCGLPA